MRRLETGSLVAAVGAALLLVSLFLSWYEPGISAWDAFEVWDLVLAGLAVAVLASVGAETGWWRGPAPAIELAVLGGAALLIVAAALINHPPAASGRGLDGGAWLGLGGAVLIVAGGLMDRVGVSLSVEPRPARRRPAAERPPPAGSPPASRTPAASDRPAPAGPAASRTPPASDRPPPAGQPPAGSPPASRNVPTASPSPAPGGASRRPARGLFQRGRVEPGEDKTTELPPRRPADSP
jgi:hypothetical protein